MTTTFTPSFPSSYLEDVFSFLLGELQAHVEQGLLQLLVEGDLLSLHGAGDEPDSQLGVVGEIIEQEVKSNKSQIVIEGIIILYL